MRWSHNILLMQFLILHQTIKSKFSNVNYLLPIENKSNVVHIILYTNIRLKIFLIAA